MQGQLSIRDPRTPTESVTYGPKCNYKDLFEVGLRLMMLQLCRNMGHSASEYFSVSEHGTIPLVATAILE